MGVSSEDDEGFFGDLQGILKYGDIIMLHADLGQEGESDTGSVHAACRGSSKLTPAMLSGGVAAKVLQIVGECLSIVVLLICLLSQLHVSTKRGRKASTRSSWMSLQGHVR